mmetsp:Transcript_87139/g.137527  ORF Transcript_87139/g.137527 Transcript_87139/m.137527 type:complete len:216 (-) Transcript_87139:582-1229(-)
MAQLGHSNSTGATSQPHQLAIALYLLLGAKLYFDSSGRKTLARVAADKLFNCVKAAAKCCRVASRLSPFANLVMAEQASNALKKPRTIPSPSGQNGSSKASPTSATSSVSSSSPSAMQPLCGGSQKRRPSAARRNLEKSNSCGPLSAYCNWSTPASFDASSKEGSFALNRKPMICLANLSNASLLIFSLASIGLYVSSRTTPQLIKHLRVGVITK